MKHLEHVFLLFFVTLLNMCHCHGEVSCINLTYFERYETSREEILQLYRGLFFTAEELQQFLNESNTKREKELYKSGVKADEIGHLPGDGDHCCATKTEYSTKESLINTAGERRYLVHLCLGKGHPPRYQYFPVGKCVDYGKCKGICFRETIVMTLLVWAKPGSSLVPPVEFDMFEVPAYCSCKHVF